MLFRSTLNAGQEIGLEGQAIRIETVLLSLIGYQGDNISLIFESGTEFEGSLENLYFILTKRDYEPYFTEQVQADPRPDLFEDEFVTISTSDLMKQQLEEAVYGQSLVADTAGGILALAAEEVEETMHPILAHGVDTISERVNGDVRTELDEVATRILALNSGTEEEQGGSET